MKLADVTPEVRAELNRARRSGRQPENGDLWFDTASERCAVCGTGLNASRLVTDHCHVTGLERARLCYPCNKTEWLRGDTPMWDLYRVTAPLLALRKTYVSTTGATPREEPVVLSDDEVATLPIPVLLELDASRRLVAS